MLQKRKVIVALNFNESTSVSVTEEDRILETDDNCLTLTESGGRLPKIKFNFDKMKLEQHLKLHSQSKKIDKKRKDSKINILNGS